MKNLNLLAAFAVTLTLLSCNDVLDIAIPSPSDDEVRTALTVTLDDIFSCGTKTVGQTEENESAINSCQVFVFRVDNGRLDASTYSGSLPSGGGCSVTLNCTAGARKVYAVVNAARDYTSSVKDESTLMTLTTDLKENSAGSLFMSGCASATLSEGSCSVSVSVSRAAASISLNRISVDMHAAAYRGKGMFKVNKIYLLNVCGRTNFALNASPSSITADYWYAKLQEETDPAKKALIADDFSSPVTIENGTSHDKKYTYYAYPNNCAHNTSVSFTPRATLLVVEASLDGETYYYPLKFDSIEGNKRYVISNLSIHRPGSKSPYEPVLFSTASASISVAAWDDGSTASVEI